LRIGDALSGVSAIFLDSAPVIYYVERNPTYIPVVSPIFERIDRGAVTAITSPVTLAECLVWPLRNANHRLERDFVELITFGANTRLVPLGGSVGRRAAQLRARYNITLTDALQVATAIETNCDVFLTNDLDLRRVTELQILVLDELEP
jgi:predicted nucleic acid-binding protein